MPAAHTWVNSLAGGSNATGNWLPPSRIKPTTRARADAFVVLGNPGSAAAEAEDPYLVDPGVYPFTPRIDKLKLVLDEPGQFPVGVNPTGTPLPNSLSPKLRPRNAG